MQHTPPPLLAKARSILYLLFVHNTAPLLLPFFYLERHGGIRAARNFISSHPPFCIPFIRGSSCVWIIHTDHTSPMKLFPLLCCTSHATRNFHSDDNEGTATSSVHTNGTAASKNMSTPNKKPAPTKPKKAADRAPQFEPYSPPQATSLFATYADPDDSGVIGPNGFEKLCNDTKISLEGALPLILAWQMSATEMAKITREEWEKSLHQLRYVLLPIFFRPLGLMR